MNADHERPPKLEDALSELDRIVSEIEAGQLGFEQALARYERGHRLIEQCRGLLDEAQEQLQRLSEPADRSEEHPGE